MLAQKLLCTGLAALRHVEYSRTGAQTCVPCIGRGLLTHCPTREVHGYFSLHMSFFPVKLIAGPLLKLNSRLGCLCVCSCPCPQGLADLDPTV